VLWGGLRVLGANVGGSRGVVHPQAQARLKHDSSWNLLDMAHGVDANSGSPRQL